jgi:hypothetical protein
MSILFSYFWKLAGISSGLLLLSVTIAISSTVVNPQSTSLKASILLSLLFLVLIIHIRYCPNNSGDDSSNSQTKKKQNDNQSESFLVGHFISILFGKLGGIFKSRRFSELNALLSLVIQMILFRGTSNTRGTLIDNGSQKITHTGTISPDEIAVVDLILVKISGRISEIVTISSLINLNVVQSPTTQRPSLIGVNLNYHELHFYLLFIG